MTANKTVVATKLAEDDKLVEIREIGTEVDGERDVVLQTVDGMFLKFPLAEIPELKKNSRGRSRDPSRKGRYAGTCLSAGCRRNCSL